MENLKLLSGRLQWCIDRANSTGKINVNKTKIAEVAGKSRAAVTYWFQDVNGMDAASARKLGDYFNVDPVWLETGDGAPEMASRAAHTGDDKSKAERQAAALQQMLLSASAEARLLTIYRLSSPEQRKIIDGTLRSIVSDMNLGGLLSSAD